MHLTVRQGWGLVLAAVVAVASWWGLQQTGEAPTETPLAEQQPPGYYLSDFKITDMDAQGAPEHRLLGDYAEHFPADGRTVVESPRMTLYRADSPPWYMTSARGVIYDNGDTALLEGKVALTHQGDEGRALQVHTHDVTVFPARDYLETDQFVVIVQQFGVTVGTGMRADLAKGHLTLRSNVRGEYEPQTDQ